MKKKLWILAILVVLLAVLVIPIPTGVYKDGGTREYTALTYKIVDWNRLTANGVYDATRVYWFPHNFQSIDGLWQHEEALLEATFIATVVEINGDSVVVRPVADSAMIKFSDRVSFGTSALKNTGAAVGSTVQVTYTGAIMETYPVQIQAVRWKLLDEARQAEFTEQWLDKETAEMCDTRIFDHIIITEIYRNCFFARTVTPSPYEIKLNGRLSHDWCVGDQVFCTYENTYLDKKAQRIECDMLTVTASDWDPDAVTARKPVIYLYPEAEIPVSVHLALDGELTCTYPAYHNGWEVTAAPDGTLTDAGGQTYNYLYWEGETHAQWDMSEGFCIKGTDTAAFLEEALAKLGLSRKEANEFIIYWLPLMEQNPYNIISFQTDVYANAAQLQPDTLIRVFMVWKASDSFVALPQQELAAPERTGFTVVEWGGAELQ